MSLEFNPRAQDHKFYGTTIGKFTEEEKELFQIDLMMSMGFSVIHLNGGEDEDLMKQVNELGKFRIMMCMSLLEIPEIMMKIMGLDKIHEMIEESKYGFSNFLKSQDENVEKHQEEIEEVVNNLKRDILFGNLSMN
jgi:hypothetical protein